LNCSILFLTRDKRAKQPLHIVIPGNWLIVAVAMAVAALAEALAVAVAVSRFCTNHSLKWILVGQPMDCPK
jgi:hypothetical protein